MCGLCGFVYADKTRHPDQHLAERMIERVAHRGPDERTTWMGEGVALAHARLRVIDLDTGGQPMHDRGRVIVYNGEVYNFRELRAELEHLGQRFETTSDTEVLLKGFDQWGHALFPKLVGMFALAIWDANTHELTLARDRLGQKPLYLAHRDGVLAFGSELSCLHAFGLTGLDHDAVATYLTHGYVCGPQSVSSAVHRVDPGTIVTWKRATDTLDASAYWSVSDVWKNAPSAPRDEGEIQDRFRDLLDNAVRCRLVADVPLGAFLSGGVDSSAIAALMGAHTNDPSTFSVGFTERGYSELPHAQRVAEHLGTDHHEHVVDPSSPDILLEIVARLDEPFADTSIIPTHELCRFARRSLTVALSGDGGDELLAGYITHRADQHYCATRWVPRALVRAAASMAEHLPEPPSKVSTAFKIKQFLRGASLDAPGAHASWRRIGPEHETRSILSSLDISRSWDPLATFRASWERSEGLDPLDRMLVMDYETWLADDINVKSDRASMAHGLEVRCPFLDHRLIEFCAPLPSHLKRQGNDGKVLLKRLARTLVPSEILDRPKSGFNAPVAAWMRGPWHTLINDTLNDTNALCWGVLDRSLTRTLFDQHLSGARERGFQLFAVLVLMLWINTHRDAVA